MSTLTVTKDTDEVIVFPVILTNNETGVSAAQDLTGAYVYFQIFDKDKNLLLAKDNDPGPDAVGSGITLRAQSGSTLGHFEAAIGDDDLDAVPAGTYSYKVLVRLDPGGADDRYTPSSGPLVLSDLDATTTPNTYTAPAPVGVTWDQVLCYAAELSSIPVEVQDDVLEFANSHLDVDCFGGEGAIKLRLARINLAAHHASAYAVGGSGTGQVLRERLGDMERQYAVQSSFQNTEYGASKYGRMYLTILGSVGARGGFVL